ncbi:unannotated protein [freshwater metagenome]|uniref:Unannotated protein n=1 Tax=freshwater metagenome TaxID=449393 RepID=A0A6J6WAR6_9ZZZZ
MTTLVENVDEIGEVVLVLRVLSTDHAKTSPQQTAAHHHDRGVDFVNLAFRFRGVSLFNNLGHFAVAAIDNPAVARGVVDHGRQHGEGGTTLFVLGKQSLDGARPQQGGVARDNQDVTVAVTHDFVNRRQGHGNGVARAQLFVLLDKAQSLARGPFAHGLFDPLGAMSDDYDGGYDVITGGRGVQHVHHHGAATEMVERLRSGRTHSGPLTGGEYDNTGRLNHALISTRATYDSRHGTNCLRRVFLLPRKSE